MNKRHPYNSIIEKKLEQLPAADADMLWDQMHSILDKKMPQKKERRRFMLWFLISKPFLLLTTGFIIGIGASLFFLSRQNASKPVSVIHDLPSSAVNDKDKTANISTEEKEKTNKGKETVKDSDNSFTKESFTNPGPGFNQFFVASQTKSKPVAELTMSGIITPGSFQQSESVSERPRFIKDRAVLYVNDGDQVQMKNNIEEKILHVNTEFAENKKDRDRLKNENGFYAGIVSGLDLSSVRFKSAKAGSTKGFIIGYSLNSKWSIESGLLWDTKRVYDDGSFFDPPAYTPTSGIKIIAVNGKTRLYELPVNIKYTILPGKNNLFATTGLSSYLMRSENYDYEYTQNNQPAGHNYLSYKNETKNWLSVLNLSVGYSRKLGAAGSLRIEPYLKIPIKEIGTAKMPITSTGLNVGFIKQLK